MKDAVSLTLNEAGYVVEQSRATINRAIDQGVIKARLLRRDKARVRRVGGAELRFLAFAAQAGKDFTPAARRKIYEAIRRALPGASRLELGIMELKLTEVDRRIDERLRRLEHVKALVDENAPEPVLRGTAVPVQVVAALARGQSTLEIVEDYPALTAEQVEAVEYAKVYPRTGRPLPARSLKRVLGDLATAGVWDLENASSPIEPQLVGEAIDEARLAEDEGMDAVFLVEHHFDGNCAYVDPATFASALAMATSKIKIGFAVPRTSLYHPLRMGRDDRIPL